jgi:hypothetical protein
MPFSSSVSNGRSNIKPVREINIIQKNITAKEEYRRFHEVKSSCPSLLIFILSKRNEAKRSDFLI